MDNCTFQGLYFSQFPSKTLDYGTSRTASIIVCQLDKFIMQLQGSKAASVYILVQLDYNCYLCLAGCRSNLGNCLARCKVHNGLNIAKKTVLNSLVGFLDDSYQIW